jgi:hypothetical protein
MDTVSEKTKFPVSLTLHCLFLFVVLWYASGFFLALGLFVAIVIIALFF